jgi:two-component system cell cycle response regulator
MPSTRVLIVEDNPINRDLLDYLLQAFGYQTLSADDGLQGLALARSEQPDIILCDVQMPGMDGTELARHLKADPATAGIALIAVTALAMVGDRDRILAAGFDGYIAKPIEPDELLAQLRRYLPAPAAAPPAVATATVLVLDDTPMNLDYKRSVLQPLGCRVLTTTTPEAALRLVREERPQLIITDMDLGPSTGLDFVRQLQAEPEVGRTPFLFVSASRWDHATREAALKLGALAYLTRPIEPQKLLDAVAAALGSPRP